MSHLMLFASFLNDFEFNFHFLIIFSHYVIVNYQFTQQRHIAFNYVNNTDHFPLVFTKLCKFSILIFLLDNSRRSIFLFINPGTKNDIFALLVNQGLSLKCVYSCIKLILYIINFTHSRFSQHLLLSATLFSLPLVSVNI